MSSDELSHILDKATVIHLQPDDVLVISNAEDIMQDPDNFHRLSGIFGDRKMVVFPGPVDVDSLRGLFEETPKFATGGFIEGPATPIAIDLSREHIITADEAHHWTAENSPLRRMMIDRWVKSGRPLNAEEAQEAEEAGLRVVEATAFEDHEPVFLPVTDAREGDRKRP